MKQITLGEIEQMVLAHFKHHLLDQDIVRTKAVDFVIQLGRLVVPDVPIIPPQMTLHITAPLWEKKE